jgi:VanZ family protein
MNSHYTWIAAIVWTVAILVGIIIPDQSLPQGPDMGIDKLVHFGLFFVFSVLWMEAGSSKYLPLWVLGGGLLYGLSTEYLQGLLPVARTPDPIDALINAAGTLAGTASHWYWNRRTLPDDT